MGRVIVCTYHWYHPLIVPYHVLLTQLSIRACQSLITLHAVWSHSASVHWIILLEREYIGYTGCWCCALISLLSVQFVGGEFITKKSGSFWPRDGSVFYILYVF